MIRELNGTCYILLAFDLGMQVDVEAASRLIGEASERIAIQPRYPAPKHFEFKVKPLRFRQSISSGSIGVSNIEPVLDLLLFDFGAISLCYRLAFDGSLEHLAALSEALYECTMLLEDGYKRAQQLLDTIRPAVSRPALAPLVEDYVMFEVIRKDGDPSPVDLLQEDRPRLAQILCADRTPLSEQEISDASAEPISYTPSDCAVVTWNTAFLYGNNAEDVRAVLEFANVQLLEMSLLDRQLETALEQSYELITRSPQTRLPIFHAFKRDLNRVARLQADGAFLYEGVSNALKLLGDQYLARLYRLVAKRFYLAEWDKGITRKLKALESIYEKLEDQVSDNRMQLMELIIVLLILFEIIMAMV